VIVYQGVVPEGMIAEVKKEEDVKYGAREEDRHENLHMTTPSAFDKVDFDEDKLLHHKISE
jgi:hypothetical protein